MNPTTPPSLPPAMDPEAQRVATCDTCEHWAMERSHRAYWDTETRECHNGKLSMESFGKANDQLVVSEDYAAFILITTGPKFGCIHHQPKTTK